MSQPNPTTAAEWAERCEKQQHAEKGLILADEMLCPKCADAYARQRVEEALEEVIVALRSSDDLHRQVKACGHTHGYNCLGECAVKIAVKCIAAIRALEP